MSTDKNTAPVETAVKESGETKFNLKLLLRFMLKRWWWFAISFVVIVGATAYYLKTTNPTYTTFARVMFNQDEDDDNMSRGGLSALMASFSMGSSGVNVYDEILRMQSHSAIKRLVNELELNKDYSASTSIFRKDLIYFQNSPIEIETPAGMLDTISSDTEFKLKISDKGKKFHLKVKQGDYKTVFNQDIPKLPYTVSTPLGKFTLSPTSFYRGQDMTFKAYLSNPDDAASAVFVNIDVFLAEKKTNAVDVKVDDQNNKRAKAMANSLIDLYNQHSVADRSAQNKATLDFLNDRLHKLYSDLDNSGAGIANYKERHQIVDPKSEASYIFKVKEAANGAIVEKETTLGILNMLREFLVNDKNKHSLIPITGIPGNTSESANASINTYNELVLELLRLQGSAKGNNSTLRQLENQVDAMRLNMLSSLDRSISAAKIALSRMHSENGTVDNRINSIPRMEQELTNMMRDNEIKNRIYAYLLQKREEAEVKLARTLPTGKIIDEAWTNYDTKRPQTFLILFASCLLALLIPACLLYTSYRNSVVVSDKSLLRRQEKDLENEVN